MPRIAIVATALFLALACAPAETEEGLPVLETEDVGGPVDVELSTADDHKGSLPDESGVGILPGTFPADVPLPKSSRLIDYGDAGGRSYVVLRDARSGGAVATDLEGRLRVAGWRISRSGSRGLVAERAPGRRIDIMIDDLDPGCKYRVTY